MNKLVLDNKMEKVSTINQGNNSNQNLKILMSFANKKKNVGNEIININLEKNLIVFECLNKLFKIDPEFFQNILVNFKKTGLLIKNISEREMIFLIQPIVNDFYNLTSYFYINEKPSSLDYFSSVTEFLRLFCENFNKVFKSLFFQLKFEYFEPKNSSKGDEDDEEDEEDEENDFPKTIAPYGFVVRKYYFMNLIFKIFSAILRHLNYFQVKQNLVSFFIPEPPGSEYFSELFDTLTNFLVETIQGNSKENFELLNSQFLYFFRSCSQYIDQIKLENDDYPVILSKIMKISLEFFQEGEVPEKIKNNILKKINSIILSDILVYKTKALNLLCNTLGFKNGKYTNLSPEEIEVIYKELFLPKKKRIGEDKENEDTQSYYSYSKTMNSNQEQQNEEEDIYDEDEIKFNSNDIINAEIEEKDHKNLLILYTILFSKQRDTEQQIVNTTVDKQNVPENETDEFKIEGILATYRKKKSGKTNKDNSSVNSEDNQGDEEEDEEEDGDEEEEDDKDTKHLLTIIDVCTKIYQFFQTIQSINEYSNKYIKYFESAKDEIVETNKFNIYKYINSFFIKNMQDQKISSSIILKSEIYEFYSSILKSIEIVHKIKLISNEIDSSKYEHIFKIFKLEMKVGDLGVSDEDIIIRKIVFLVDPVCLYLKYDEALKLIERQNFEESTTLLTFVVEQIGEFKNIINLRKNIKSSENSKEFKNFERMENLNFFYLQIISIILALITNVRMATTVSLNVNNELIEQDDPFLSFITILHLLQLAFSVYVYFYLHYIKLSQIINESKKPINNEKKESSQNIEESKKPVNKEEKESSKINEESKKAINKDENVWTNEMIFDKVIDLAVQEEILYLLWSFVFASIAFIFSDCRFLYSLLLFPIFQFIPTIQDILHAVKLRAGQFFSAGLIIVLFVFFYSIIGIYFFKDKFIDPDTGVY
jgi:hypothetical protein